MIEATIGSHELVEYIFPGMTEGCMAKVMGKRERLGEIIVEAEGAGRRARDLPNFERMGKPCAEMIAFMRNEDLSLVGKSAESRAMDNTVTIAFEWRARGGIRLKD